MYISKKEFSHYTGMSYKTACKLYETYLHLIGKQHGQYLTLYNIAKLDDVPINELKEKFGRK